MRQMQNLQVWLMDDPHQRFAGAHVTSKKALRSSVQWRSLATEFTDLIGELSCPTGSTDGLYILSSHDGMNSGIKDVLLTRVFADEVPNVSELQLPQDTIGALAIVSQNEARYGSLVVNHRAIPTKPTETILFKVSRREQISDSKEIDTATKVALLAMTHGLRQILDKA